MDASSENHAREPNGEYFDHILLNFMSQFFVIVLPFNIYFL